MPKAEKAKLRLKPQPKLPPLSLLTHLVQKPGDSLLLRQSRTIKMPPDSQGQLLFTHAVLAGYLSPWGFAAPFVSLVLILSLGLGLAGPLCSNRSRR